mmetsp:Transcript_18800/g.37906  ORF Transcript_18800/g.37906 Transcript_18800/m.37906 type:complete len:314 (-) Transcript_18800:138-1079(-)
MAASRTEYYHAWDRIATQTAQEEEEEEAAAKARAQAAALQDNIRQAPRGYEFRKGHRIQFPDCAAQPGENDEQAAFRVASERRSAGVESFNDGSVWGAQGAVDAWGQGLLALERLKNLRRYKPLESVGREEDIGDLAEPVQLDPSDEEVVGLMLTLRLNIAQALLKLRDFESCVVHCDKALELDPTNVKGLWRRAKAVWGMRNPGFAREALNDLLSIEPGNAAAKAMLREIDQEEAKKRVRRTGARVTALPPRPPRRPDGDAGSAGDASAEASAGNDGSDVGEDEGDEDDDDEGPGAILRSLWCCRRRKSRVD